MSLTDRSFLDLTNVKPQRHQNGALSIHPYFGKLDPALASTLIESFSKQGDIVLDPFCGSGTVLHESLLLKRSVIGWDSSPLAILLATAKLLGIAPSEHEQIVDIIKGLEQYSAVGSLFQLPLPFDGEVPPMPRVQDISSWFSPNALAELAFLRGYLKNRVPHMLPVAAVLTRTAFSRIIVAASNQQGESTYRRVQKPDYPGRVITLFIQALEQVCEAAGRFNRLMEDAGLGRCRLLFQRDITANKILWNEFSVDIFLHDTRTARNPDPNGNPKASLVVSSPPYLMSWDYGLYHKFRFYWLGFDLDSYEETEIGRHLRRKQDDIQRYRVDMLGAFHSMGQALTPEAYIALVNAPSVVYGKEVDTNIILAECGEEAGWKLIDCIKSIGIPGPHHGMYASLTTRGASAPGERGKREHILIFRRDRS